MLFAINCTDKPDSLELRMATRPTHLAYLIGCQPQLMLVGPVLTEGKPAGSLIVIEADDLASAEAFAANDPYALAGLFAEVRVQPFRMVFKDGAKVA
jgi:uncharacterized protein YciI